ncbi:MAG: hypothetical protein WKF81_09855, partial [Thermomicrobiales bacterium]
MISHPSRHPVTRHVSSLIALLIAVSTLAACSSGDSSDPEPTTAPTATLPLAPGQQSLGQLLDGVEVQLATIASARTVFSSQTAGGTPTTSPVTTEEYIAPDSRRIVTSNGTTVVDEQIAIGAMVYMRGSFVSTAVAPMLGSDIWVNIDPALVPADTPVGNVVSYLTGPYRMPFASISDDMRSRGVTQAGQIDIAGRTCTVWIFVDTTSFGDRIDYALSIDAQGLPCSLTERAGTVENLTTF